MPRACLRSLPVLAAFALATSGLADVPPGPLQRIEGVGPYALPVGVLVLALAVGWLRARHRGAGSERMSGEIDYSALPRRSTREWVDEILAGLDGRYADPERLGTGGMAEIYRARDTRLDRPVAFKVLTPEAFQDDEMRERFLREARALASLDHTGLPSIYDVSATPVPYFIFRYIEGRSLAEAFEARGPLPAEDVRGWLAAAAEALAHAHDQGLVHRDVKPENLMVGPEGRVVLIDLGIARADRSRDELVTLTREGQLLGTPEYMAPELWMGSPASAASDQFAWAAAVVRLGGGPPVYGSQQAGEVLSNLDGYPARLPQALAALPARLRAVLSRALDPDPAARLPSMEACVEALQGLGDELGPAPTRELDAHAVDGPGAAVLTRAQVLDADAPRRSAGGRPSPGPGSTEQGPRSGAPRIGPRAALASVLALALGLGVWSRGPGADPSPGSGSPSDPVTEAAAQDLWGRVLSAERAFRRILFPTGEHPAWSHRLKGPDDIERLRQVGDPQLAIAWSELLAALSDVVEVPAAQGATAALRDRVLTDLDVLEFLAWAPTVLPDVFGDAASEHVRSHGDPRQLLDLQPARTQALEAYRIWRQGTAAAVQRLEAVTGPGAAHARYLATYLSLAQRSPGFRERLGEVLAREESGADLPEGARLRLLALAADVVADDSLGVGEETGRLDCDQLDPLLLRLRSRVADLGRTQPALRVRAAALLAFTEAVRRCPWSPERIEDEAAARLDEAVALAEDLAGAGWPQRHHTWWAMDVALRVAVARLSRPGLPRPAVHLRAALTRACGAILLPPGPRGLEARAAVARVVRAVDEAERELRRRSGDPEAALTRWSARGPAEGGVSFQRIFAEVDLLHAWGRLLGGLAEVYAGPHATHPAMAEARRQLEVGPGLSRYLFEAPRQVSRAASFSTIPPDPDGEDSVAERILLGERALEAWAGWGQAARVFARRLRDAPGARRVDARAMADLVLFVSRAKPEATEALAAMLAERGPSRPASADFGLLRVGALFDYLRDGHLLHGMSCARRAAFAEDLLAWQAELPLAQDRATVLAEAVRVEGQLLRICGGTEGGALEFRRAAEARARRALDRLLQRVTTGRALTPADEAGVRGQLGEAAPWLPPDLVEEAVEPVVARVTPAVEGG